MSFRSNQLGVQTHHHALQLTIPAVEPRPFLAALKLRRLVSLVHRRLELMVIIPRLVDFEEVPSIIRRQLLTRLEVHSRRLLARITVPRMISLVSYCLQGLVFTCG